MIQSQMLPPGKSVHDYPISFPGQELTEEQQQQAQMAQIAAIVLAAAAGKKALSDAVTNQIVALLRVTDLTSEVAVSLFAKQAASLVRLAVRQSRSISWSSVAARSRVVGISLPSTPPSEEEIPKELRYSRGTDLETAYTRLAEEYRKNRERTATDPQIVELVRQYESQNLTPLPRPDNVSSDVIEGVVNGQEAWREAFARASEKALQDEGREVTIFETDEEETAPGARAAQERARAAEAERASSVATAERSSAGAGDSDSPSGGGADSQSGDDDSDSGDGEAPTLVLTDAEVDEVIERYAEQKVEERAERMVGHDVQAASRNMHQVAMRKLPQKKVIGFRRVVHPELSKSGRSCGLCIVASTMWYTRRELLPIHAGCNCETCEIYDLDGVQFDPGHQINMEDLDVFYREAGDTTRGWDLKRSQYEVIDHPEYGPTLMNVKAGKMKEKGRPAESVPFERKQVSNGND